MDRPEPTLLEPRIQRYAWGDARFIPDLLGLDEHEGPCAEAWFGAHPQGPARVVGTGEPLDAFLEERREAWFGPELAREHEGLPYLLKLLAAARPLSIQAHPDREQARVGFAREEAAGIPRDAPHRCYRDPNHKPEVILALTDFHALCGFHRGEALAGALASAPELAALLPGPPPADAGSLRATLEAWFALPDEAVVPALEALLGRLAGEDARSPFPEDAPEHWALVARRELFADRAPDRGLLFVFLLEHLRLSPGQALFLPAGVPHAYLRGAGVELMASSDNVLRAGLTPKHVAVDELLSVVRFDAGAPPILEPVEAAGGVEATYPVPSRELDLRRLRLEPGRTLRREAWGPETWLALPEAADATVRVSWDGGTLPLRRGQACLVPHGAELAVDADEAAELVVAGLPRPASRS